MLEKYKWIIEPLRLSNHIFYGYEKMLPQQFLKPKVIQAHCMQLETYFYLWNSYVRCRLFIIEFIALSLQLLGNIFLVWYVLYLFNNTLLHRGMMISIHACYNKPSEATIVQEISHMFQ